MCGWCYWVNNILYYPNLLMSTAVVGTYVIGRGQTGLADNWTYVLPATLAALWLAVRLNIVGVRTGRWLQNLGARRHLSPGRPARRSRRVRGVHPAVGHADRRRGTLMPDLGDLSELNLWASIAFAFAGLELCAVMGGEVKDPAADAAALDLHLGAADRVHLHRRHRRGALAGADRGRQHRLRVPAGAGGGCAGHRVGRGLAPRGGGGASTSSATSAGSARGSPGPARVAFVIGLDRYFPPAFGRVHPRWQTPYVAILTQAVLATVFLLLSVLGKGHDGREGLPRHPRHDAAGLLHPLHLPLHLLSRIRVKEPAPAGGALLAGRPAGIVIGLAGLALTLFAMTSRRCRPAEQPTAGCSSSRSSAAPASSSCSGA